MDTELIGGEISGDWSYLRPITKVTWKQRIADVAVLLVIVAFVSLLLWLASIGVL